MAVIRKNKIGYCGAVIVAAGSGTRMQPAYKTGRDQVNKVFLMLNGDPILSHTLSAFENCNFIDEIVLVTRECDIVDCKAICDDYGITKLKTITAGGQTRQESVRKGLGELSPQMQFAAIHDAARCLITPDEIASAVVAAHEFDGAALGIPCKDSLKAVDEEKNIISTVDRDRIWQVQTPQVFSTKKIIAAHNLAAQTDFTATDDCAVAENYGMRIKMVQGSYANIKITTPEDLLFAEGYLAGKDALFY